MKLAGSIKDSSPLKIKYANKVTSVECDRVTNTWKQLVMAW